MNNDLEPPPSMVDLVTSTYDPNSKQNTDKGRQDAQWKQWFNNLYEWVLANMNKDFFFEVALGNVNGHASRNVVSHSDGITTSGVGIKTVWEEASLYTYSATANINTITSTDAGDTHDITIVGLDSDWNEITQTATLNGQTPVTLSTSLIRVNQVRNDTSNTTAGEVYVWVSGGGSTAGVPDTAADIRARITMVSGLSNERSVSSVCSVPANKKAVIVFGKASATDNKAIELTFWVRQFGGVFQLAHHVDFKDNNYDYFFKLPAVSFEKSDIEVRATTDAQTSEVSANYDIVLVDA